MTGYRCEKCDWVTECSTLVLCCGRCGHPGLEFLVAQDLLTIYDSGEITHCKPCGCVHTGSIRPRRTV